MVSVLYDQVIASTLVRIAAAESLAASSSCPTHLSSAAAVSLITICAVMGVAWIILFAVYWWRPHGGKYTSLTVDDDNVNTQKPLLDNF